MSTDQLQQLAATLSGIAKGDDWECLWDRDMTWGHPAGRDVEYCIGARIPIRLKPAEAGEKSALEVLKALMQNPSINLGDLVYTVRENEGKGWEGPNVTAWGEAVAAANALLLGAGKEGA